MPPHLPPISQMMAELEACGLGPDTIDALWEAYQAAREEEEAMSDNDKGGASGDVNKENKVGGVGRRQGQRRRQAGGEGRERQRSGCSCGRPPPHANLASLPAPAARRTTPPRARPPTQPCAWVRWPWA